MRSAFNKEILRSITGSAGRFAAIVVISLLGAGFFAGLRMAAPDMRLAGDEFFDATNTYDISVATSLGLDDDSVELLAGIEGVGEVMPAYRANAMVRAGEGSFAASVESLPEAAAASDTSDGLHARSGDDAYLNRPILEEGTWPTSDDECVVGADAARELGIAVGDALAIEEVEGSSDDGVGAFGAFGSAGGGVDDTFAADGLMVTGLVSSPLFIASGQMGTTSLGSGEVELYLYVPEGAFADGLPYSVVYLTVPAALDATWDTPAYGEAVAPVKERAEALADELADARLEAVEDELHFQLAGALQEMSSSLDWSDGIEPPDVYVMDRSKNPGMASLSSDADGIAQIATFLPFMFFLVAALVSLTSMTRMVDEERLEVGTHKALGYGRGRITSKYLVYGALASGIGAAVGIVALGKLLPWFILTSYAVSYDVPSAPLPLAPGVTAAAFGLSLGITLAATWGAAAASLRERPAALMLPRAPKAGKRIFLERIRPLWSRMSFSHKVTARNLLRYKRRFFMAVVGVAGCTALLMVGFGLRDAIGGIVANQYGGLVKYDLAVRADSGASQADGTAAAELLQSDDVAATLAVDDFTMIAEGPSDDLRIEVVVPSEQANREGAFSGPFQSFVELRDRESGEPVELGDGVVLTEKAAEVLGVHVGDEVVLFDENDVGDKQGDGRAFTIDGIAENYLGHYAYLSPGAFERAFGEAPSFDLAYVKLAEGIGDDARAELVDGLLAAEGVATVSAVSDKVATYEEMLAVMDKLIVVIVLLSAALAFVVLYNLTNINIAERVREIATLKVLGFTRRETNAYIFREVFVMALVGALLGCILGVPLTFYIARAAETANMMFGRTIEPLSYVLSFAITLAFAGIVAFTMRGRLARVDMAESLKSNE